MRFDPHHLSALSAVLRLGSFEAAAHDLSVTPSAISQRIKALEERVGTTLINRGTPCTGTPAGQRLAKHAEDVGLLEQQLSRELSLEDSPGATRVRIAVNADSLATWFVPALASVPDMLFDLVIDDQDHSADWLRRGEVSAAVCASGKPVAGCDAVAIGALRYHATASPGFHRNWFADGVDAVSLSSAPCITFNAKDGLQRQWMARNAGARIAAPVHFLPSTHAFIDAGRSGLGWGMNPAPLIRGPMKNGRLVELIPDTPMDVALTWQVSRVMAPALQDLTKAVRKAAAKVLIPPADKPITS
ncbi:LysR family transcriptional regulator ArgP [Primorskyibacter sp. S87]|uniref:LysR family transcriptional regulator ArgP n=1 Tax=Primorskyibacter sp. S87 TaxID=3415126 RepID=UPI003C7AD298